MSISSGRFFSLLIILFHHDRHRVDSEARCSLTRGTAKSAPVEIDVTTVALTNTIISWIEQR
jgi:predicted secreted protein